MTDRILIASYSYMGRKADVYYHNQLGYEVDFFAYNKYILSQSYEDKSLRYHEDAAENYVNGIKQV